MRTLARDIKKSAGKEITLQGWLHKKRLLGGLTFINMRDRTGLVQVLVQDKQEVDKIKGMQIGTVLEVSGKVVEDERAPGGAEIHDSKLKVIVPVTDVPPIEIDKPISHNSEHFDTLFEYRPLNLRNLNEQKVFKIRAAVNQYIRDFLTDNEFVEIQTPKLLAGATEGGAEVFKLDYFGQEATLAQSPQFYKQMMVGVFERVFEIGPAYRAEPSMTTRHLSEITMLDVELGFVTTLDEVLKVASDLVNFVVKKLWQTHGDILRSLNATEPVLSDEYPKMTMAQVHEQFSAKHDENTVEEKDLIPAEERWVSEHGKKELGSEAVFVTEFPASEMKFYHKGNDQNPNVADRADLIFRGVELATIPLREHRYEKIVAQMKKDGLDPEHPGFRYYLQAFQYGLPPHGGFGFGIDRFVQQLVGLNNIKEATLFPRDIHRLAP